MWVRQRLPTGVTRGMSRVLRCYTRAEEGGVEAYPVVVNDFNNNRYIFGMRTGVEKDNTPYFDEAFEN